MQFTEFHKLIEERSKIHPDNDPAIEKQWKKMAEKFSVDIEKTILFLNECTADEFSWLSEIFDDIAEKTRSKKFISALRKTAEKFPEECKEYPGIYSSIDCAEHWIE